MPAPRESDGNLLFGILALQMDFVSRDALVAGMNAWVLDKARPLGQVLQDQGALRPDARALLDALVQKHLELHGGDAEKSLAALSSTTPARRALEQVADPDVQASLAGVGGAAAGDDLYATRSNAPVGTPTSSGLRFRILRPYAKGGLGEVFVAHDEELKREVALKEIQNRHADQPESRSRFLLEAEVTGALEHPGIVPVYGLGQYADGRPFYAMRFIKGDSLQEAVERFHRPDGPLRERGPRALALRELLGRFVDVCNAMAYAHTRGVLHRDLKPGNVMLGKYGETLVVDWGLAKPVEGGTESEPAVASGALSGSSSTQMGQAVGTPQYMSPEQAAGRLDQLGPASDVYSLGATLYCLLAGRSPFTDRDVGAVLRQVQRGDFPPPRRVNREVPPALEGVCLKAMALRPGDRYASARALADDVEHWLADEPVTAYRDPPAVRLGRWARRHRPLVAGLAGLLLTAVVALAVTTVLVSREQARTEEQRRLAEANFQTALRAVNDMLTEVAEEKLVYEPRMEEKRRRLLEEAQHYYQDFLDQKGNDLALRKETALAAKRLGDIARLLGKRDQAAAAYRSAIDQLHRLAAEHPDEPDYRLALAESYNFLGEVFRPVDRPQAEDDYRHALGVLGELCAQYPDRARYREVLANAHDNLGILLKDGGHRPEAEKAFRQATALLAGGDSRESRHLLARVDLNLGPVLQELGRPAEAEQAYQEAIRLQNDLVREQEEDPDFRYELAVTYNNLGFLLEEVARGTAVLAGMPRLCEHNLGILVEEVRRYADAERAYAEALKQLERLVANFPGVPDYRKNRANTRSNQAIVLFRLGARPEAEAAWKAALDDYDYLLDHAENGKRDQEPEYRAGKGRVLGNVGWYWLQRKDRRQAEHYLEEGIREVKAALEFNPDDPTYRRTLEDQKEYLEAARRLPAP